MNAAPENSALAVPAPGENPRHLLIFGIIAGVFTILALSTFLFAEPNATDPLSTYKNNVGAFSYGEGVILFLVVFATPFVASLGSALVSRGRGLVWAAMFLSVLGMLCLALNAATLYGAFYAAANTPAPIPGIPAYEARLWLNLDTGVNLLGIVAWGFGLLLFGLAAWNSRILPRWLAVVGVIGGGASLLALIVPIVAFVLIPVAFGIWCFAAPLLVRRLPTSSTTPTASQS